MRNRLCLLVEDNLLLMMMTM